MKGCVYRFQIPVPRIGTQTHHILSKTYFKHLTLLHGGIQHEEIIKKIKIKSKKKIIRIPWSTDIREHFGLIQLCYK